MNLTTDKTFRLSRIYAAGWNAANRAPTYEIDTLDLVKLATRNPYALEEERSIWTSGFTNALATERPKAKQKARS